MIYKDLSERCMINPHHIDKGEKRVFYLKAKTPFLDEPRSQNKFRNEFISKISQIPQHSQLNLMADELQKSFIEKTMDRSSPSIQKEELAKYFKRRQYKLQHKRYKLLLRWAHFCMTSDIVDQVSLKFNSAYSKIQFELENSSKRFQRLDGDDHFQSVDQAQPNSQSSYKILDKKIPISALRSDDIDVYLRCATYEEKVTRQADKFIQHAKWLPLTERFNVFKDSIKYFQKLRNYSIQQQNQFINSIEIKGQQLIDARQIGNSGQNELKQIKNQQYISKLLKKEKNKRDQIMNTAQYNYEIVPFVFINEIELKLKLLELSDEFSIQGNIELDQGYSFSYQISTYFPIKFKEQVLLFQFSPYDTENRQQFYQQQSNLPQNKNKSQQEINQLLNNTEKTLFGEINNGQNSQIPIIRLKQSDWLDQIVFKPEIEDEQMQQQGIISCEKNILDKCFIGLLNVSRLQDLDTVEIIIEALSKIHVEKVKTGGALINLQDDDNTFNKDGLFSDDQLSFLSIFQGCLNSRSDNQMKFKQINYSPKSLYQVPVHLLQAHQQLIFLRIRDNRSYLLHLMNGFRSIQRRITLDIREMGTRDRVLGDNNIKIIDPQIGRNINKYDYLPDKDILLKDQSSIDKLTKIICNDDIDIINESLFEINKYRFNNKFVNIYKSTCPTVPRFHQTFGQPVERQEISTEIDYNLFTDVKREQTLKLIGRADRIYQDQSSQLILVKDDFGINIIYDCAFLDVESLENEIVKIASFFINKIEPVLDRDLTNIYPTVDRLLILDEIMSYERQFYMAKFNLVQVFMECYEHISDILEQQRIIQIIIDEMAKRPRINLKATHYKDSYQTEINCLKQKTLLVQDIVTMLIKNEFKENNHIREYIEKTYRLLHEVMENKWSHVRPENREKEMNKRQLVQTGEPGIRNSKIEKKLDPEGKPTQRSEEEIKDFKKQVEDDPLTIFTNKFGDPKEFSNYLGMPYSSLEMLMKEHHERDSIIRQSIHEHVSFIKIQEGYPQFIYQTTQKQNLLKLSKTSEEIGILDFYESMHSMSRILSSIQLAFQELKNVHSPDNGLMTSCLEINTIKYLRNSLKKVQQVSNIQRPNGINYIEDDEILGNSDKMLFYSKELESSAQDSSYEYNPFLIGKLELESIQNFDFNRFQGFIDNIADNLDGANKDQAEAERMMKVNKKNFGRFFPTLKETSQLIQMPTLLILNCNILEVLKLRNQLLMIMEQTFMLENIFQSQNQILGKDFIPYLKESFKFNDEGSVKLSQNDVNFIEEGPATNLDLKLAINEFDKKLRSHLNFQDSECFKMMILPMGLEELRAVVQYEIINLQALIVAIRTNQILLDNHVRKQCEVEFFENGYTIANPSFNLYDKLWGKNLQDDKFKNLHVIEKQQIRVSIASSLSPLSFNLVTKFKLPFKYEIEKNFNQFRESLIKYERNAKENHKQQFEKEQKIMRCFRTILCQIYCKDMLGRICCESIKFQLMNEVNMLRKKVYLIPKEQMFFEIGAPISGEHEYVAYSEHNIIKFDQEESRSKINFFDSKSQKIQKVWQLPNFSEILNLNIEMKEFFIVNPIFKKLPQYIDFKKNSLLQFVKNELPQISQLSYEQIIDADNLFKWKGRFVDFSQAYNYEIIDKNSANRSDQIEKQFNQPLLYLQYWKSVSDIFDMEFFWNKLSSSSFAMISLELNVKCGLPFWEEDYQDLSVDSMSEEDIDSNNDIQNLNQQQKKQSKFENEEEVHQPKKNILALKVVQKLAKERGDKALLFQDIETIQQKFNEYGYIITKQEMTTNLMRAAQFLNDINQITYMNIVSSLYIMQSGLLKDQKGQKEVHFISQILQKLTNQQENKITYFNGFHVNNSVTNQLKINVDANCLNFDYSNFFLATQPIIDEEALNPPEFNFIQGIYDNQQIIQYGINSCSNYMGSIIKQTINRDYNCLQYALINLSVSTRKQAISYMCSFDQNIKSFASGKMGGILEVDWHSNPIVYNNILQDKKLFLRQQLRLIKLRNVLKIIIQKKPISLDFQEFIKTQNSYISFIQFQLQSYKELKQKRTQQITFKEIDLKVDYKKKLQKSYVPGGSLKAAQDSAAMNQYDDNSAEIEVCKQEILNFLMQTSLNLIRKETDSLVKAFEMSTIQLQAFIHPCQQFASTFDQKIDNRHHLDIINKVSPIQKMLTQIQNRSVEIETQTSGQGIIITWKDLNESLNECCRSLIKYGEIEMRTRTEFLALQIETLQDQLYHKDQQFRKAQNKLVLTEKEIEKIVSSRVFSSGKELIYGFDQTQRQHRIIKDRIYMMEQKLAEQIHLRYQTDLNKQKVSNNDIKVKFKEYQSNINSEVGALVKENLNQVELALKQKSQHYKNLDVKTKQQIITEDNIKSLQENLNKSKSKNAFSHDEFLQDDKDKQNEFELKYYLAIQTIKEKDEEIKEMKKQEIETQNQILKIQDVLRKQRIFHKINDVLKQEKHSLQMNHLKREQTENGILWDQLAESENREKILRLEIEKNHKDLSTLENIIESLQDHIKNDQKNIHKLSQYRINKGKRLDLLESQAREYEVLNGIDLSKMIGILEKQDKKIDQLHSSEIGLNGRLNGFQKQSILEIHKAKIQAQDETQTKNQAIHKIEQLRQELLKPAIEFNQNNDQENESENNKKEIQHWKQQCHQLFNLCVQFKKQALQNVQIESPQLQKNLSLSEKNVKQNSQNNITQPIINYNIINQNINIDRNSNNLNNQSQQFDQNQDLIEKRLSSQFKFSDQKKQVDRNNQLAQSLYQTIHTKNYKNSIFTTTKTQINEYDNNLPNIEKRAKTGYGQTKIQQKGCKVLDAIQNQESNYKQLNNSQLQIRFIKKNAQGQNNQSVSQKYITKLGNQFNQQLDSICSTQINQIKQPIEKISTINMSRNLSFNKTKNRNNVFESLTYQNSLLDQ